MKIPKNTNMSGRKQINLSPEATKILDDWASSLVSPDIPKNLKDKMTPGYSDTIIAINEKLKKK